MVFKYRRTKKTQQQHRGESGYSPIIKWLFQYLPSSCGDLLRRRPCCSAGAIKIVLLSILFVISLLFTVGFLQSYRPSSSTQSLMNLNYLRKGSIIITNSSNSATAATTTTTTTLWPWDHVTKALVPKKSLQKGTNSSSTTSAAADTTSTTTPKIQKEAFKHILDLYAEHVGYPVACSNLYEKLRPTWTTNAPDVGGGEMPSIPKHIQDLWAPILDRPEEGITMASLEMQYNTKKKNSILAANNMESERAIMTDTTTTATPTEANDAINNNSPAPAPAHFYCLCPKRTELCNEEYCDTIITFNDASNEEFNLPNSTWTTARNAMYYLAKRRRMMAQFQDQVPESHYCFMDGDVKLSIDKQTVQERLAKESELNKIIAFNYRGFMGDSPYLYSVDAHLNCFASSTMDQYLPYSTLQDHHAWSLSQTDLVVRANMIEPLAFKMYTNIKTFNPSHSREYPRKKSSSSNDDPSTKEIGEPLQKHLTRDGFSPGCHPCYNNTWNQHINDNDDVHNCTIHGNQVFSMSFQNDRHQTYYLGFCTSV